MPKNKQLTNIKLFILVVFMLGKVHYVFCKEVFLLDECSKNYSMVHSLKDNLIWLLSNYPAGLLINHLHETYKVGILKLIYKSTYSVHSLSLRYFNWP